MKVQNTPQRAAFDVRSAQDVRTQFQQDPQAGLKAAAQQFETLFLQMVMKSMRDATPQDGLMDSDQTRFYNGLLDQQMASNLTTTGQGLGFARLIEQQLGRQLATSGNAAELNAPANAAAAGLPLSVANVRHMAVPAMAASAKSGAAGTSGAAPAAAAAAGNMGKSTDAPANATEFVNRVWPHAVEASRATGIPPQFLIAQAALETGWGKSEPKRADGTPTHNLFGIKAGKRWNGATADLATTEYVDGAAQQTVQRFRAYNSYADSFRDYAELLRDNPRYSAVIGSQSGTDFAQRLQQAGYATDPAYADKLARIINGPTLRQALIG